MNLDNLSLEHVLLTTALYHCLILGISALWNLLSIWPSGPQDGSAHSCDIQLQFYICSCDVLEKNVGLRIRSGVLVSALA